MITCVLMAKAPRPGFVKTRLAQSVGNSRAAEVYRELVELQLRAIPADWQLIVAHTPDDAEDEMRAWLGPRPILLPQGDGDLGERLERCTREAFQSPGGPVVILGGDCPELTAVRLHAAARELTTHDVVLWPTLDGGYCLIGLARFLPQMFQNIPWSTNTVLTQSLTNAATLSVTVMSPPLEDIDDAPSLARWHR